MFYEVGVVLLVSRSVHRFSVITSYILVVYGFACIHGITLS